MPGHPHWRIAGSQFGTECRAQESSGMMLRISLRRRELLGARTPIFPCVPVPGTARRASERRGCGMGNGREKRRKVSMDWLDRATAVVRVGGRFRVAGWGEAGGAKNAKRGAARRMRVGV